MRWSSRQRSIRIAVSTVLAGFGLMIVGCDQAGADANAVSYMRQGDFKAAARERDASNTIQAIAAGRAADEQLARTVPTYRELASNQVMVFDSLWYLSRLATMASQVKASAGYLSYYNPQEALSKLDSTVAAVKGNGQQDWSPADLDVQMPTIASLTNRSNPLKDGITELENQLNELRRRQQSLTQQSEKLLADSRAAKGEQALELYKQSADTRKQATEVSIQIANAEAALVPLQQQLAVVEDQIKLINESVNVMTGHRDNLERSWRGITAQADERADAVSSIFASNTPERPGTIPAQAARLSELIAEQERLASQYEQDLQEAVAFAKQAVTASDVAYKEAQQGKWKGSKNGNPYDLMKVATNPATARFTQAHFEFAMGTYQAGRAAELDLRARVLQNVAEIARELNQPLPQSLDASTAQTQAEQASAAATDTLSSAEQLFATASEAPAAAQLSFVKRSATIGHMAALHAESLLSQTKGDAAAAKQYLDQAKAVRDQLQQSGEPLPSLPTSLK